MHVTYKGNFRTCSTGATLENTQEYDSVIGLDAVILAGFMGIIIGAVLMITAKLEKAERKPT